MSDESGPDSDGTTSRPGTATRRRYLKLLTAGAAGGAVAVGTENIVGDEDSDRRPVLVTGNGSSAYDVVIEERSEAYEAIDPTGDTLVSGSDGWTVLADAVDSVPEGGSIFVSGRYDGTSTIEIDRSIQMVGQQAHVDHRQLGEPVFHFEGEERRRTSLVEPANQGDDAIALDGTSGMQQGDMVLLEEVDGDPVLGRGKPPGEPHSVLEVDGGTVRLEDSIVWRDGYPSGTLVYVIDPIEVHVSGFNLAAPAKDEDYLGVTAHQCRDSSFEGLRLEKFGNRGILLEACANCRVRDCTVLQSADVEASDGYGIQVWAGCHDVVVDGCIAKECRHPLSVTAGGDRAVASRSIAFRDCFVTARGSSALNCHGGSAHDVRFEGCIVHTRGYPGVMTGAQKTAVSGCEFRTDGHNAVDTRGDGQEMILAVTDTDIFGAFSAVHLDREDQFEYEPHWKLVHLEGVRAYGCNRFFELNPGAVDGVGDLVISDCYWDEVAEDGLRIENSVDGGVIEGNDFGGARADSHIRVYDESGVDVTSLEISDNSFRQPNGTDTFVRLAHCRECTVSGNAFHSGSDVDIYEDEASSTANQITENTYYAPDPSADPVAQADGSFASENAVYDTAADRWL